jgi:hypothetical protein
MKTGLVIGGFLVLGIGLADLLFGNTDHPILPAFVGDNLSQQGDVAAVVTGGAALWYGLTKLR